MHLLQIGPSLILSGIRVSRGRREAVPEIELDGPDRPRQMVHHVACDAGGVPRPSILAKHVAELQFGHGVKRREEGVPAVLLHVFVLVDRVIRQREGRSGFSLQRPRPIQDDLQRIGEAGCLQFVDQREVW